MNTITEERLGSMVSIDHFEGEQGLDIFECGICTDDLKVPKSLPCLHNFCQDCLSKYFLSNHLGHGATFQCPNCRQETKVPEGGAKEFPTNFHVEKIRQRTKKLDLLYTIGEAMEYLETREEEITEELGEQKRQTLVAISDQRDRVLARMEEYIEGLRERIEDQFIHESTRAVEVIQSLKQKLVDLSRTAEVETPRDSVTGTPSVLRKLKRQAEVISNIANEMEELKGQADREIQRIMDSVLNFYPGEFPVRKLDKYFGMLHRSQQRRAASLECLNLFSTMEEVKGQEVVGYGPASPSHTTGLSEQQGSDGFDITSAESWSQSWWVLLAGVMPAVIFGLMLRYIYLQDDDYLQ